MLSCGCTRLTYSVQGENESVSVCAYVNTLLLCVIKLSGVARTAAAKGRERKI